jgi:hypothetical protein
MTTFMAECFWPGVTEKHVLEAGARGRQAAVGSARYLGSILIPTDEIALCFFEAASIDAAVGISRQAAIPFERIIEIVQLM